MEKACFPSAYFPGDSIGAFLGSHCDKEIAESHVKSAKVFNGFVVNSPGEDMKRALGMGM